MMINLVFIPACPVLGIVMNTTQGILLAFNLDRFESRSIHLIWTSMEETMQLDIFRCRTWLSSALLRSVI